MGRVGGFAALFRADHRRAVDRPSPKSRRSRFQAEVIDDARRCWRWWKKAAPDAPARGRGSAPPFAPTNRNRTSREVCWEPTFISGLERERSPFQPALTPDDDTLVDVGAFEFETGRGG